MSIAPVTSHPNFTAASAAFQAAVPLLEPASDAPNAVPTLASFQAAGDELQVGMALLHPMTSPSTQWLHQAATASISQAQRAIQLLRGPAREVAYGELDPAVGSPAAAAAVRDARDAIAQAVAAATL